MNDSPSGPLSLNVYQTISLLQTGDRTALGLLHQREEFCGGLVERGSAELRGKGLAQREWPQSTVDREALRQAGGELENGAYFGGWSLMSYCLATEASSGFQPSLIPLAGPSCVAVCILHKQALSRVWSTWYLLESHICWKEGGESRSGQRKVNLCFRLSQAQQTQHQVIRVVQASDLNGGAFILLPPIVRPRKVWPQVRRPPSTEKEGTDSWRLRAGYSPCSRAAGPLEGDLDFTSFMS